MSQRDKSKNDKFSMQKWLLRFPVQWKEYNVIRSTIYLCGKINEYLHHATVL